MAHIKLFVPSPKHRYLELVEVLDPSAVLENGCRIKLPDGSIETTTEEYLFSIPGDLIDLLAKPLKEIIAHQESLGGATAKKTKVHAIATTALAQLKNEK